VASIAVHGLLLVALSSDTDKLPTKAARNDVTVELISLPAMATARTGMQTGAPAPQPLPDLNGVQVTHSTSDKKAAGRLDELQVARRVRAGGPNHKKATGRLDELQVARRVRAGGPDHKKATGRLDELQVARRVRAGGPNHKKAVEPAPVLARVANRSSLDTRLLRDRIPRQTVRPASSRQEQRAGVQAVRKIVRNHLEAFKYYPASARRRGIEGEVDVSFFLTGGGLASRLKVLRGSGYAVLDRAALKTVARAQPFPVDYGEYRFRLHFRRL